MNRQIVTTVDPGAGASPTITVLPDSSSDDQVIDANIGAVSGKLGTNRAVSITSNWVGSPSPCVTDCIDGESGQACLRRHPTAILAKATVHPINPN